MDQPAAQPRRSEAPLLRVDESGLFSMRSRPPLHRYIAQLWQRRFFIWADAKAKSLQPGADMILGNLWLVLNPILNVAIYGIVFGILLRTDRGIDNFLGFLILGVIFFTFFSRAVEGGSGLIQDSESVR
ncbi:ABC transporter permease [Corynebacterium frankenforstense]